MSIPILAGMAGGLAGLEGRSAESRKQKDRLEYEEFLLQKKREYTALEREDALAFEEKNIGRLTAVERAKALAAAETKADASNLFFEGTSEQRKAQAREAIQNRIDEINSLGDLTRAEKAKDIRNAALAELEVLLETQPQRFALARDEAGNERNIQMWNANEWRAAFEELGMDEDRASTYAAYIATGKSDPTLQARTNASTAALGGGGAFTSGLGQLIGNFETPERQETMTTALENLSQAISQENKTNIRNTLTALKDLMNKSTSKAQAEYANALSLVDLALNNEDPLNILTNDALISRLLGGGFAAPGASTTATNQGPPADAVLSASDPEGLPFDYNQ